MTTILTGATLGAVVATGCVAIWRGARPPKPALLDAIRHSEQHHQPAPDGLWNHALEFATHTTDTDTLTADLAVLQRTRTTFALARIQLCATLAVLPIMVTLVLAVATGSSWNPTVAIVCTLIGTGAGVVMSKMSLSSEAAGRRRRFTEELAAYLDIVAQLVAGGAGTDEALWRGVRAAETPGLAMIRDALASARVRRRSEWAALAELANATRLPELAEMVTAIQLASTDGARIRASLQAKAKSLRAATAAEQLASANRASEAMGGPLIAMLLAFLAVVLAPTLAQVLSIT